MHTTRFFEFTKGVAQSATDGDTVRLAPVRIRPVLSYDVAAAAGRTAAGAPVGGVVEVAGAEAFRPDELIRGAFAARNDPRTVVADRTPGTSAPGSGTPPSCSSGTRRGRAPRSRPVPAGPHSTVTTTECHPLAPSGTVRVRFSVCTSPVRSVARTVSVWPPLPARHA